VVEHARNADLLVHEAYGSEDAAEWAQAFCHSSAAEAGRIARDSMAKRLALTHSRASRFADPEQLAAAAALAFGGSVEAAHDLDAFGC
jgi:ribonuclease Z